MLNKYSARYWCWNYYDLFLRFLRHPRVLKWFSDVPSLLYKLTAGCNSPDNWLMSLAMDSATWCDMWRRKWHQLHHMAVFTIDVECACHFVATCLPSSSHPIQVLVVSALPVKNLSKMVGNSINSWWIDRLSIAIGSLQISCKHLFSLPSYNISNN